MLSLAVLAAGGLTFGDPSWFMGALLFEPFAIGYVVFARRDDCLTLDESGVTDMQAHLTRHWDWDEVAAIGAGSEWLTGAPLEACCFGRPHPRRLGGFRPRRGEAANVLKAIADSGGPVFAGSPSWNWDLDDRSKNKPA